MHRGRESLFKGAWIFMEVELIADGVILPSNHICAYIDIQQSLNCCRNSVFIGLETGNT